MPWTDLPVVNKLERGIILDGYYTQNGFSVVINDIKEERLVQFNVTAYFPNVYSTRRYGTAEFEQVELYDSITCTTVNLYCYPVDPKKLSISGNGFVNYFPHPEPLYFHNKQIIPGSVVRISDKKILTDLEPKLLNSISPNTRVLAGLTIPLLEQDIPVLRGIAFDIEVMALRGYFPRSLEAKYPVHTIAFNDTTGKSIMYIYGRTPTSSELHNAYYYLPGYQFQIKTFLEEEKVFAATFELLESYPIIFSYNGDLN